MAAVARLFEGFTFKVASASQRDRSLDLRRQIYTKEHGKDGIDPLDKIATHLVAIDKQGTVVSALRVLGPTQRPFDLECCVSLDSILSPNSIPAEISRFCVAPHYRTIHRGQVVHLGMLKLLYEFAGTQRITDLLTLVLPGLEKLYEVAFFEKLDLVATHPTWGRATVMHMNIERTRRTQETSDHPVANLLFKTFVPNVVCP